MIYDIAVVGGGPAGITAALYGYRAGKKVIIFERDMFGGNMNNAPNIENYPGYTSISGMDLAEKMTAQIENHVEQIYENVTKLDYDKDFNIHKLITDNKEYRSKTVILATGSTHRKLLLPNEDKYSGISYCALCDGSFYKDKDIIIIGGGNSAFQEAIYLSNICKMVNLVYRGETFRADKDLINKTDSIGNITLYNNLTPTNYITNDNNEVTGMLFEYRDSTEIKLLCDGVFVAIGQDPNIELLDYSNGLEGRGFIVNPSLIPNGNHYQGIYTAGDCIYKSVKQIVTAVSDGACAATNAIQFLNKI